jgi:hypothetical protein
MILKKIYVLNLMKELSTDLFYPIMGITIAVVTVYYIKNGGKCDAEKWSSLVDSQNILYPNPPTHQQPHGTTCQCPRCPGIVDPGIAVRDVPVYPESNIGIVGEATPYGLNSSVLTQVNAIIPSNMSYNRDYRVINDPLYPPEQRSDNDYYYPREVIRGIIPTNNSGGQQVYVGDNPKLYGNGYFRYPTRGYPPPYQMKGYLVDDNNSGNILSIFGRPKYLGSTQYQYYVSKRDLNNNEIKIDISNNREIYNGETVKINKDIFPGNYKFVEYKTEELIQPPLY